MHHTVDGRGGGPPGISAWGILTGALERWEQQCQWSVIKLEETEHSFTIVLPHTVKHRVWLQFEEATGAGRLILYGQIASVL